MIEDAELVTRAIELLRIEPRKYERVGSLKPLWQRVRGVFGLSLTEAEAREICTRHGFIPGEIVKP